MLSKGTMRVILSIYMISVCCCVNTNVGAFVPQATRKTRKSSKLFVVKSEATLRQEIADRNVNKANEDKYIVVDGENLENVEAQTAEPALPPIESGGQDDDFSALLSKVERLTEPRAYPLFMAEKAAELAETTVAGLAKAFTGGRSAVSAEPTNGAAVKERIVILGTGWGAASFVKDIDTNLYDITVISPRNYFVFTPMLAGASVGTVEFRSITEPIREINSKAKFLEATATNVDPESNTVTCESVTCGGNSCEIQDFNVEYDRLIVTVGAQTNTFGIPGVREHCNFLKQVEDARRIRNALINCFERANIPNLSDKERMENVCTCETSVLSEIYHATHSDSLFSTFASRFT